MTRARSLAAQGFVVLHLGRTGSTYLVEALDAHPRIRAAYETLAAVREAGGSATEQVADARAYLSSAEGMRYSAVGFKTKLRDILDREAFASMLRDVRARIIYLQRRNVVKQAASVFMAERIHELTGDWNLYTADATCTAPCVIEPARFFEMLDEIVRTAEAVREYIGRLALPTLAIDYEDLLLEHDWTLRRVFSFLGVEPARTAGRTVKATSDDLRTAIANFDALRAAAGVRYNAMFDEVLVPHPAERSSSG